MNKIRVCAFLALVVFIGSVVTDMFSGFMDGWNEAGDQKDFHALPSVSLLVRADDTLPADTLISAAQDTPMYCNTSEVSVQGFRSTKWRWVSFLLSLFFIPCFKWNKHYYVQTSCCNTVYELDAEVGKRIAAGEDVEILPQHLRRMNQQGYGYSMKRCRNCGFSTTEDFEYCPKCGTRLSE